MELLLPHGGVEIYLLLSGKQPGIVDPDHIPDTAQLHLPVRRVALVPTEFDVGGILRTPPLPAQQRVPPTPFPRREPLQSGPHASPSRKFHQAALLQEVLHAHRQNFKPSADATVALPDLPPRECFTIFTPKASPACDYAAPPCISVEHPDMQKVSPTGPYAVTIF